MRRGRAGTAETGGSLGPIAVRCAVPRPRRISKDPKFVKALRRSSERTPRVIFDLVDPGQGDERRPAMNRGRSQLARRRPIRGGAGSQIAGDRVPLGSDFAEEPSNYEDLIAPDCLPVLVEPPLALLSDVGGPDGLEGAQAPRGVDVADDADAHHGRRLDDGHRLNDLLLVHLGAGTVGLPHDVGHAGLVADEGGQVAGLGRVVLGEGLDLAAVALAALLGVEPHRAMAGRRELAVRLEDKKRKILDAIFGTDIELIWVEY